MGSALRQAPSPICGVRQNPQLLPSWKQARPELDKVEDTSATPVCRMIFSARLLTNWSSFPLRNKCCLLCLPRRGSVQKPLHWLELGGLAGVIPLTGTVAWSLVGVKVPAPPNLSAQGCHLHCSPLHPNLLGDIPPLIKTH